MDDNPVLDLQILTIVTVVILLCKYKECVLKADVCIPAIYKSAGNSTARKCLSQCPLHYWVISFYYLFAVLFHSNGTASKWPANRATADISKR